MPFTSVMLTPPQRAAQSGLDANQVAVNQFVSKNRSAVTAALKMRKLHTIVGANALGDLDRTQLGVLNNRLNLPIMQFPTLFAALQKPCTVIIHSSHETEDEKNTKLMLIGEGFQPLAVEFAMDLSAAAGIALASLASEFAGEPLEVTVIVDRYDPSILMAAKSTPTMKVILVTWLAQAPLNWNSATGERRYYRTNSYIGPPDPGAQRPLHTLIYVPPDLTLAFHAGFSLPHLTNRPQFIDFAEARRRRSTSPADWTSCQNIGATVGQSLRLQQIERVEPSHLAAVLGPDCLDTVDVRAFMVELAEDGLVGLQLKEGFTGANKKDAVDHITFGDAFIRKYLPPGVDARRLGLY